MAPSQQKTVSASERRRFFLAAVAATVAALVIRVHSLGPASLYRDDTWQAIATRATSLSDIARAGVAAPGYAFLLRAWSTVAGHSTLALQIPAVAAGVAAPILVYPLARRFGLRPWPALVAGVFLFTSQIMLQMSVRVKPFALDALVTMALLALALRASEAPRNDRRWLALLVVAALALFFSASTLPVIAAAI